MTQKEINEIKRRFRADKSAISRIYGCYVNAPGVDVQEARVSIYTKGNYTAAKNAVVRMVLAAGLTVTARQYIGYEPDTGYHHYNVDVAHFYELEG